MKFEKLETRKKFNRKDAIERLLDSWREENSDDTANEARQRCIEDDNFLDLEKEERGWLQEMTDDELQDRFQEMLATEFGHTLNTFFNFVTNFTEEDSAKLMAEIKADDNLRRKINDPVAKELLRFLCLEDALGERVEMPVAD